MFILIENNDNIHCCCPHCGETYEHSEECGISILRIIKSNKGQCVKISESSLTTQTLIMYANNVGKLHFITFIAH